MKPPKTSLLHGRWPLRDQHFYFSLLIGIYANIMEKAKVRSVSVVASVLLTKLHVPSLRRNSVTRLRLLQALDEGLQRKLTLVCAPAGFGKSTLLSSWIEDQRGVKSPPDIAWLSLNENDNDLNRFLIYFISAIQTAHPAFGVQVLSVLESGEQTDTEKILTILLNEAIGITAPMVLILDDYHFIESSEIDEALGFFLQHLPEQLHLYISSRIDPSLHLSRIRAQGQMVELRSRDLRFSTEETEAFLHSMLDVNLSDWALKSLESRTEGWITGLQLLALSLEQCEDIEKFIGSFTGSSRYILDYLGEEVLNRQSEGVCDFLFKTSILDNLSPSLCDAVTGKTGSGEILNLANRLNLFLIPLDEEEKWFRYHHLFADFLRQKLIQKFPADVSELHMRDSRWYLKNESIDEAFGHAIKAEKKTEAKKIIERRWHLYVHRGELEKLTNMLEQFEEAEIESSAPLSMARCWICHLRESYEQIPRHLDDVRRSLKDLNESCPEDQPMEMEVLPSLVETMAAVVDIENGKAEAALQHANNAITLIPERASPAIQGMLRSSAVLYIAFAYQQIGDLESACRYHLRNLELMKHGQNAFGAVNSLMEVSQIYKKMGRENDCIRVCRETLDFLIKRGWEKLPPAGIAHLVLAVALADSGDREASDYHAGAGRELIGPIKNQRYELLLKESEKMLPSRKAEEKHSFIEPLSRRELEALTLIAEGLSNDEICERLFLALSTVKGHNRNIYGKLQVERRTEAVARAQKLGLI